MSVHSVSSKGWVVIPANLRKKYALLPGTEVRIVDYGGVLAIVPAMKDPLNQAAGILKSEKILTKKLMEEHRNER
jgi:AbrB family looped-hinge helix DNA binding protein